jgi:hypothetical protein
LMTINAVRLTLPLGNYATHSRMPTRRWGTTNSVTLRSLAAHAFTELRALGTNLGIIHELEDVP